MTNGVVKTGPRRTRGGALARGDGGREAGFLRGAPEDAGRSPRAGRRGGGARLSRGAPLFGAPYVLFLASDDGSATFFRPESDGLRRLADRDLGFYRRSKRCLQGGPRMAHQKSRRPVIARQKSRHGLPALPGALFQGRDARPYPGIGEGATVPLRSKQEAPGGAGPHGRPFRIHGERGWHFVAELFTMVGGKIGNHREKRDHHGPTRSGIRKMPHGGGCLLLGLALMIGVPALAVDEAAPAPPEQSASQAVGESAPANPESANTDDAASGATIPTARRRRRPRTTRRFPTIPQGPRPPVVLTGRKTLSIRRIPPTRRTRATTPVPRRRGPRPC